MSASPTDDARQNSVVTSHTRPLFLMGNKRSGTSLLVRLLNEHPAVFVGREADVVWMLFQIFSGARQPFQRYEWDGPVGLEATLAATQHLLEEAQHGKTDVRSLFTRIEQELCRREKVGPGHGPKRELLWLGDKKPVQHCDPRIRPFLRENFGDAKYIHIIRHPAAAVGSMVKAAKLWKTGVPPFWNSGPKEILARWTTHEEWVLDARNSDRMPIHSLRLEDLSETPSATIRKVLGFLDLDMPAEMEAVVNEHVSGSPNQGYEEITLDYAARDRRILDHYGYAETVTA